jgi:hypothetical protein
VRRVLALAPQEVTGVGEVGLREERLELRVLRLAQRGAHARVALRELRAQLREPRALALDSLVARVGGREAGDVGAEVGAALGQVLEVSQRLHPARALRADVAERRQLAAERRDVRLERVAEGAVLGAVEAREVGGEVPVQRAPTASDLRAGSPAA